MIKIKLFEHQIKALEQTKDKNRCAYYLDMGLGKTFVGSEKLKQLNNKINLVICQKSKINDWIEHFIKYYPKCLTFDLTKREWFEKFTNSEPCETTPLIGVINYDLITRRDLSNIRDFTLMLDESSLIQNMRAKRTRCIMKMKAENVILLSGTPTGGRYERLYSQLKLLGYNITKTSYYNMYVNYHIDNKQGFPIMMIDGYKNVERLKDKMSEYGCVFMKSNEVLDLPQQIFTDIKVKKNALYTKFMKNRIVKINDKELVGDTTLTKMLYARMLCSIYNDEKIKAFNDLLESTNDRLIVFYNFNDELEVLKSICDENKRKYSVVNGSIKNLDAYENISDSITLVQYQAGAMGLNLQKANKIVYFSPCLSSELYEQSKKRTHRIKQEKTCFYYKLIVKKSIEEKIYKTLDMRKDYTNKLFEKEM